MGGSLIQDRVRAGLRNAKLKGKQQRDDNKREDFSQGAVLNVRENH